MRVIERNAFGLAMLATISVLSCSAPTSGRNAVSFGTLGDISVQLYTLTNKHGLVAKITNYGAILTELHVPDRTGAFSDIVLGFENLDGYTKGGPYFGAIVGRVANRIKDAEFTLEGK